MQISNSKAAYKNGSTDKAATSKAAHRNTNAINDSRGRANQAPMIHTITKKYTIISKPRSVLSRMKSLPRMEKLSPIRNALPPTAASSPIGSINARLHSQPLNRIPSAYTRFRKPRSINNRTAAAAGMPTQIIGAFIRRPPRRTSCSTDKPRPGPPQSLQSPAALLPGWNSLPPRKESQIRRAPLAD